MGKEAYLNHQFLLSEEARPIRIASEYIYPHSIFESSKIKDTIVFFGSARINESNPQLGHYYRSAQKLAELITEWSLDISKDSEEKRLILCTGGGPGIMEAGNKGARKMGGISIALNIQLPHEQHPNPYIHEDFSFEFHYFFMRKLWFAQMAKALVVFPGGFGTIDELFEILTLVQTKKTAKIPILLFGSDFWNKIINFPLLAELRLINPEDYTELIHMADTPDQAIEILRSKIQL